MNTLETTQEIANIGPHTFGCVTMHFSDAIAIVITCPLFFAVTYRRVRANDVIVTLPLGVDGFIPTNHLGHSKLKKAADYYKVDDKVPAKVIEFDKENKKIVLSVSDYFKEKENSELENYLSKQGVEKTTLEDLIKPGSKPKADKEKEEDKTEDKAKKADEKVEEKSEEKAETKKATKKKVEEKAESAEKAEEKPKKEERDKAEEDKEEKPKKKAAAKKEEKSDKEDAVKEETEAEETKS